MAEKPIEIKFGNYKVAYYSEVGHVSVSYLEDGVWVTGDRYTEVAFAGLCTRYLDTLKDFERVQSKIEEDKGKVQLVDKLLDRLDREELVELLKDNL